MGRFFVLTLEAGLQFQGRFLPQEFKRFIELE